MILVYALHGHGPPCKRSLTAPAPRAKIHDDPFNKTARCPACRMWAAVVDLDAAIAHEEARIASASAKLAELQAARARALEVRQ